MQPAEFSGLIHFEIEISSNGWILPGSFKWRISFINMDKKKRTFWMFYRVTSIRKIKIFLSFPISLPMLSLNFRYYFIHDFKIELLLLLMKYLWIYSGIFSGNHWICLYGSQGQNFINLNTAQTWEAEEPLWYKQMRKHLNSALPFWGIKVPV